MKDTAHNNGEVHLLDYLIVFARHSRIIIYTSVAVTVLTYLICFVLPNKFTGRSRMMPPQQNVTLSTQILDLLGGGGVPQGGGGMVGSLLGFKSPGDLYVGIMKGDTVLDRIIARFHLMELYETKTLEDTRDKLKSMVKITADKTDSMITIKATSYTPEQAAQMANAFCEELNLLLRGLAQNEAKGQLAFLEKERLQTTQNLTKAEEAVRHFSEQNSVLQIDTQTKGALEYIARLRAEIDSKEVSIQVLRQQATPFNYDVVRLETEIKGLKEKLRTVECQYDSNITDVCLPTNKTPALALEYIRLYREAKFQEALYQLYSKLVEIARLDMVRNATVVQVVDVAKPPENRSNKRLLPALLLGTATFFLMVFATLILEYWTRLKANEKEAHKIEVLTRYLHPYVNLIHRCFSFFQKKKIIN